jgi:myo-inositol-1(or 4)-monophosphatase
MMKKMPRINFLENISRAAGQLLMKHYTKLNRGQIRVKGHHDYVTEVDRLSEKLLIKKILFSFPDHQIMAEETAHSIQYDPERPLWVIDPLDGTTNFIHQYPVFSVSIALYLRGKAQLGVVYDPNRNELFSAVKGHGAFLNGRKIKVSRTRLPKETLLATGFPFRSHEILEDYLRIFRLLCQASRGIRRGGSAALELCCLRAL